MKKTVSIFIPSRKAIKAQTSDIVLHLAQKSPIYIPNIDTSFDIDIQFHIGETNINSIRNKIITKWYKNSCNNDILLMIDDDQTFTFESVVRGLFLCQNADIVVGDYCSILDQGLLLAVNPAEYKKNGVAEIVHGPTGFMFITRPIITKIIKEKNWIHKSFFPFFNNIKVYNPFYGLKNCGEDYSFCHLIKSFNGKIIGFNGNIGHVLTHIMYHKRSPTITHINANIV